MSTQESPHPPEQPSAGAINGVLRLMTLNSLLKTILLPLFVVTGLVWLFYTLRGPWNPVTPTATSRETSFSVAEQLRESADLVTLELTIDRLAVYDSEVQTTVDRGIAPRIRDFFKNSKTVCAIPVRIVLRYGYDLNELSARDILIDDSDPQNRSIEIHLPKPGLITSGYNLEYYVYEKGNDGETDYNATFGNPFCVNESGRIFTDRNEVSHGLKEQIRHQAYVEALRQDFLTDLGNEVRDSAKLALETILRGLGYRHVIIVTKHRWPENVP